MVFEGKYLENVEMVQKSRTSTFAMHFATSQCIATNSISMICSALSGEKPQPKECTHEMTEMTMLMGKHTLALH